MQVKTLHLSIIIILSASLGIANHVVFADNVNKVEIQNIQVQPSTVKVGNTLTVTTTLVNNFTFPIWLDGGKCSIKDKQASFITVMFDNHAKIQGKDINCAGVGWSQVLDPGKSITTTSPDYTVNYIATEPGTANTTMTFSYHVINQTDPTQPGFSQKISKSFLFTIMDNDTGTKLLTESLLSPLKQFKSGISALDVKCPSNYALVIKSEDGSPACVRPLTVKVLSEVGWTKFESTQSNHNANAKTNPFGIVVLMYYYGGGPCGVGTCPLNTFNLKMNSNYTAYLLGYNICNDNSCIVRNDLSILLPLNVIGMPNYKFITLSENPQWKYDDVFHIQVEVSSIPDNKTAIWTDLGNSTIIH